MFTPDIRLGHGVDVHALIPGDGLVLLGVKIPYNQSLKGHSDADVGLHAIIDAILGTTGKGDIGTFFSDKDPQYEGMDSSFFVEKVLEILKEEKARLHFIDVTILGEKPKISKYREEMKKRLSEILELPENRISVKATTTEKLGFLGREEGLAAFATATIYY